MKLLNEPNGSAKNERKPRSSACELETCRRCKETRRSYIPDGLVNLKSYGTAVLVLELVSWQVALLSLIHEACLVPVVTAGCAMSVSSCLRGILNRDRVDREVEAYVLALAVREDIATLSPSSSVAILLYTCLRGILNRDGVDREVEAYVLALAGREDLPRIRRRPP